MQSETHIWTATDSVNGEGRFQLHQAISSLSFLSQLQVSEKYHKSQTHPETKRYFRTGSPTTAAKPCHTRVLRKNLSSMAIPPAIAPFIKKEKLTIHQPLYNQTSRSSPRDREKVFLLLKGKRSWKFRNKIAKWRNNLFLKEKSKVPVRRPIGVTAENRNEKQAKKAISHGKYRFGAVRALFLTL